MLENTITRTGQLFGDLWHRYDEKLFEESVGLFLKRFEANGFDLGWFESKRCLDAGCGGGRYSIAMGRLGAAEVIGCDISKRGLNDARTRSKGLANVRFEQASVLALPYEDSSFDFVICSGVLHHTSDPDKGLDELTRVLRKNGKLFLLLYGQGGLRWPTIMKIRPHAQAIGYEMLNEAMRLAGLPANKQRTFLDDLFVPVIGFYSWTDVQSMLSGRGFCRIQRWQKGKLDHETSVPVQRTELEQLLQVFTVLLETDATRGLSMNSNTSQAIEAATAALQKLDTVEADFEAGRLDEEKRRWEIFGWGHHRVLAVKG